MAECGMFVSDYISGESRSGPDTHLVERSVRYSRESDSGAGANVAGPKENVMRVDIDCA